MNFRLDVAISDIVGKSGLAIIRAILDQQYNPQELSRLADKRVKKIPIRNNGFTLWQSQRGINV